MNNFSTKKTALLGPTGSGKTTGLMNQYRKLVEQGISTNEILVLLRSRGHGMKWREQIDLPCSSKLRMMSYFGFIQGEIQRFWPILQKTVNPIQKNNLEPVFTTVEISQYMMLQIIEEKRKQGMLSLLHTNSEHISMELIQNLSKAVMAGRNFDAMGELLYHTSRSRDLTKMELFQQLQGICDTYIERCKDLGVIDYATAIDLYHGVLEKDKLYQDYFLHKTRHIIVDDAEDAVASEIWMLHGWMDKMDTFTLGFNTDGELRRSLGACPELVEELLLGNSEKIFLDRCFTCSKRNHQLANGLDLAKEDSNPRVFFPENELLIIDRDLRSEMIKAMGEKIIELLEDGVLPGEIVIITPYADPVMNHCIGNMLHKKGYGLQNLTRYGRLIDDAYVKALVTIGCIAHPQWNIEPSREDLTGTLAMILKMDKIRSSLLAGEIVQRKPTDLPDESAMGTMIMKRIGRIHLDRYELLRNWVYAYMKGSPLSIKSFLQKLFVEVLLPLPDTPAHLETCRQLIDNSSQFLKIMIGQLDEPNISRAYIELVINGMKSAEGLIDMNRKIESQEVILATPFAYLDYKYKRKIQIWADISSEDWYANDVKEITNPHVFHPHWDRNRVWTEADSEAFRLKKGNILVKRLLHSCTDRVIYAQSQLNRNGYEQTGRLSDALAGIYNRKN